MNQTYISKFNEWGIIYEERNKNPYGFIELFFINDGNREKTTVRELKKYFTDVPATPWELEELISAERNNYRKNLLS